MPTQQSEGSHSPRIVRGRVDSLSLYEITDYELQALEEGSVGATYLNFAIFLLSVAVSLLATLFSANVTSDRVFTVFVVVIVVGLIAGVVLLVLWYRTRRRMSKVLERIKKRCSVPESDDVVQDNDSDSEPAKTESSSS